MQRVVLERHKDINVPNLKQFHNSMLHLVFLLFESQN